MGEYKDKGCEIPGFWIVSTMDIDNNVNKNIKKKINEVVLLHLNDVFYCPDTYIN